MPNRIVREGILTSDKVNALDWEAEVFFRRLISIVDDWGRFDARPAILRPTMYPLKLDQMRETNIQRCLTACSAAGLVRLYDVAGKRYLEVLDFRQRTRSASKWPSPPGDEPDACPSNDGHMSDSCPTYGGRLHAKTEAKTESYAKTKTKTKTEERLNQNSSVHSDVGADAEPWPATPQEVIDFASALPLAERPKSAYALERSCLAFADWLADPANRRRAPDWRRKLISWLKQDALREAEREVNQTQKPKKKDDYRL